MIRLLDYIDDQARTIANRTLLRDNTEEGFFWQQNGLITNEEEVQRFWEYFQDGVEGVIAGCPLELIELITAEGAIFGESRESRDNRQERVMHAIQPLLYRMLVSRIYQLVYLPDLIFDDVDLTPENMLTNRVVTHDMSQA